MKKHKKTIIFFSFFLIFLISLYHYLENNIIVPVNETLSPKQYTSTKCDYNKQRLLSQEEYQECLKIFKTNLKKDNVIKEENIELSQIMTKFQNKVSIETKIAKENDGYKIKLSDYTINSCIGYNLVSYEILPDNSLFLLPHSNSFAILCKDEKTNKIITIYTKSFNLQKNKEIIAQFEKQLLK